MYPEFDLNPQPILYSEFAQLLSDNGYTKTGEKYDSEIWEHESKERISFPRNENYVVSDYVYYALRKADISPIQMELYKDIIFGK